MAIGATIPFRLSKETRKKVVGGKAAKSSTKHQSEHGGIQRPDRAITHVATTTICGIERNLR